jgi:hypothetical protein
MIVEPDDLQRRRAERIRQTAMDTTVSALTEQFGDAVGAAISAPTTRAAFERYIDTIIELNRARASFLWVDAGTSQRLVDAATAYRDAQLALHGAVELAVRDAIGVTEH